MNDCRYRGDEDASGLRRQSEAGAVIGVSKRYRRVSLAAASRGMAKRRVPGSGNPRRGTLIIEAIVGAIVLGAAISLLVPLMSSMRHQRQAARFETLSMVELNNIDSFLPEDLERDASLTLSLSDAFQNRYPTAKLQAERLSASESDEVANSLQAIRLTVHRPSFAGMPDARVSIVVWRRITEPAP